MFMSLFEVIPALEDSFGKTGIGASEHSLDLFESLKLHAVR